MVRYLAFLAALLLPAAALAQSSIEPGAVMGRPASMAKGPSTGVDGILGGVDGTLDLKPPAGLAQALKSTQHVTGTAGPGDTWINQVLIETDGLAAANTNIFGAGAYHLCCTGTAQGWRFALGGRIDVDTPWSPADPYASMAGGVFNARASVAAPSAGASITGANSNVQFSNGATGWGAIVGHEIDVIIASGAGQPSTKWGLAIHQGASDAKRSTGLDYGLTFNTGGSTPPGWSQLINIDSQLGNSPISPTGTVLGMRGPATFYAGIDFQLATITGATLVCPNASCVITGQGDGYFTRLLSGVGNLGVGVYPSLTSLGYAVTTNFTGSEVSLWNTVSSGQGFFFRQKTGASSSIVSGAFLPDAPVLGATALQIYVNNNAGKNTVTPSLGAVDSGGSGFRLLRVPN